MNAEKDGLLLRSCALYRDRPFIILIRTGEFRSELPDDFGTEGHKGEFGHLEALFPERDADNCDA